MGDFLERTPKKKKISEFFRRIFQKQNESKTSHFQNEIQKTFL